MTLPPDTSPPPGTPAPGRVEIDGGEPNGFVVVVLDRDVDPDPDRDLAAVLTDPPEPGPPGVPPPASPGRLLAVLRSLGDPPTRRLVAPASRDAVQRLQERGRRGRPTPGRDLTRFWRIDLRDGRADPREVAQRIRGLPGVDLAYAESQVVSALTGSTAPGPTVPDPTPVPTAPTGLRAAMLTQGHLRAAPDGVGAEVVRTRCGAGGQDVRFVDVEEGWRIPHPAYSAHAPDVLPDTDRRNRDGVGGFVGDHGTAVLGVVAATGAGVRVVGVAPRVAEVHCCSHYDATTDQELHTVDAIAQAVDHLRDGDVLLLEVQRPGEGGGRPLPTEIDPGDFEAISNATGAGIVVVEAAGNGTRDLDLWRHPTDGPLRAMRRDGPGDSTAVVVGSCVAKTVQGGHARYPDSNWGARVDCYAWGESVATAHATVTTGDYTTTFNGTSAAAAIVAGGAVATQGMQRAAHPGAPLDPATMRAYLSGPANTPQRPVNDPRLIGRMPDLAALADRIGAAECPDDGGGDGGVIG